MLSVAKYKPVLFKYPANQGSTTPPAAAAAPPVPEGPRLKCRSMNNTCVEDAVLFKAHGPLTGYCIESDR